MVKYLHTSSYHKKQCWFISSVSYVLNIDILNTVYWLCMQMVNYNSCRTALLKKEFSFKSDEKADIGGYWRIKDGRPNPNTAHPITPLDDHFCSFQENLMTSNCSALLKIDTPPASILEPLLYGPSDLQNCKGPTYYTLDYTFVGSTRIKKQQVGELCQRT